MKIQHLNWIDSTNQRMVTMSKLLGSYKSASSVLKDVRKASSTYEKVRSSGNSNLDKKTTTKLKFFNESGKW
jgi:hypothetical protein